VAADAPRARAGRAWLAAGALAAALALGVRAWNALAGPLGWGYDAWGHVAYVLYLDLFRALPHADQGWSYFHPPLHYLLAWPLCLARSGEWLLRGLLLLASAASLATAALAARVQLAAAPGRAGLAWLAFAAVALWPAQLAASAMPGNEATAAFLTSAAVAHFIAGGRAPSLRRDAVTGLLLGLALCAKYSALVAVAALAASLAVAPAWARPLRPALRRTAARAAVIGAALCVVAGPLYARNLREQGALLPTSHDDPWVRAAESGQPPGARRFGDYLRISPRLFTDASPLAPHQLRSVWGSLYASAWFDTHRESDRERALWLQLGTPPFVRALLALGLLPTALALAGAALALRDVARGRRREVYLPLLCLAAAMLAAQAVFAWRTPTWAALKASYLLPASLAFGVFLARGFEALAARARGAAAVALAGLAAGGLLGAAAAAEGWLVPRRGDSPTAAATWFYFGEYAPARRVYEGLLAHAAWPVPWLDNLAAAQLASGELAQAKVSYRRAVGLESAAAGASGAGPLALYRQGQLAAALALDGDLAGAAELLDAALARRELPELRANLGALRAARGEPAAAEADLRAALAADPGLWPAWENLAFVLARAGRDADARAALASAREAACRAPRGEPPGVGSGENVEWGVGRRWRLRLDADGALRALLPADERAACARLAAAP
jgi:hypothetical protein